MESSRGGGICRRFINGSCRLGPRCHYRHEWAAIPSTQICRYFQKGGCWYGEHCRYLHVLQPEANASGAGRRSSVPTVTSSSVAYAPHDRRGSEPVLLQAGLTSRRSEFLADVSNPQHNIGHHAADITEEQSHGYDSDVTASWESVQGSEVAQSRDSRNEQETSSNDTDYSGAAAAAPASSTQGRVEDVDFLQSEDMTCGICMDKVYEKTDPRNRVFGILPNCNHCFCLECIMKWRKTKDLGLEAVKSCPQCRVRSAFYVPNKHWVEGQAKESVIAAFREKFSKKRCRYFAQYRCCPFKSECLYHHDISKHEPRMSSLQYPTEDTQDFDSVDLLNLFITLTLLSDSDDDDDDDDDDDFDFPFYLSEGYDF